MASYSNQQTQLQSQKEVLLPFNFQPSPHTVIVGRGKEPKQNLGNHNLRILAMSFLDAYRSGNKKCKTKIVSDIIKIVRNSCFNMPGAFVKHCRNTGEWYDLDDSIAREKVSYQFRDLLADQYKSSSKSKVAKRHSGNIERTDKILTEAISCFAPSVEDQKPMIPGSFFNHTNNTHETESISRCSSSSSICSPPATTTKRRRPSFSDLSFLDDFAETIQEPSTKQGSDGGNIKPFNNLSSTSTSAPENVYNGLFFEDEHLLFASLPTILL